MKSLLLHNFKCFRNQRIQLNQLTAFLGTNGVGKSSVIQALLLLKATLDGKHGVRDIVPLNGPYGLALGTSTDVMTQDVDEGFVRLALLDENVTKLEVTYDIDNVNQMLGLPIVSCDDINLGEELDYLYFLSAERLGPRASQPLQQMDYLNVGIQGEYTAQVIDSMSGREKVRVECMYGASKDPNLATQVNMWMNYILPGVKIYAKANYEGLSANIRIENQYSENNPLLPTNIGFGISYVLPVVTTGLIAREGSIMIVENPEAHLHPAAQSAMGEFLGMVARSGVMVVIETHSDHIISGLQIDAALHPEFASKITINNFSMDKESDQPKVESIGVEPNGNLMSWPEGFMSQAQIDFVKLTKIQTSMHV